jgi:hypothetical protein
MFAGFFSCRRNQNHVAGAEFTGVDVVDSANIVYEPANVLAFASVCGGDPPERIPGADFDLGVDRRFCGANGLFGECEACQERQCGDEQQKRRKPAARSDPVCLSGPGRTTVLFFEAGTRMRALFHETALLCPIRESKHLFVFSIISKYMFVVKGYLKHSFVF